jgi:hypothetical protein
MVDWFHVGQRVVFCNAQSRKYARETLPWPETMTPNRVLTIRDIDRRYLDWWGVLGLRFEELQYPAKDCGLNGMVEPAFPAYRFRPCRETDISVFTAVLAPTKRSKAVV